MKAYRVQSTLTDNIFYVGYKKEVDQTLQTYFSTHFQQSLRKHQLKLKALQEGKNQKDHPQDQQSQPSQDSSKPESSDSTFTDPQYIVLHIMLYDLTLQQYNEYHEGINKKFQSAYKNTPLPVKINVLFVSSREESLKYVRKIQKMMGEEFEKSLMYLHSEWEKTQQYELVKNYLMEKFQWSREEAFVWMTQNNVNTLDQLFILKDIPNYQKKEIKRLISNLALLQELCKD